jgi:hypothetical protein
MRERKDVVARGVLTTAEIMQFFDNISMLKVSAKNKLEVKVFDHNVPNNTWSVSLFAKDEHRSAVVEVLSGYLSRWLDKFYIKPFDKEN